MTRVTIDLGTYQFIEITQADLGDQFTEGGKEPHTVVFRLTTMDEPPFENRTAAALLTEQDQRRLIEALQANLRGEVLA